METAARDNTGYYSALEVTKIGATMQVLVNPDYAEMFPTPLLNAAVAGTLLAASRTLQAGDTLTFTHHPRHDFYLHIAVNNSGAIKVDGGGVEPLTLSQVGEYLESVAAEYS